MSYATLSQFSDWTEHLDLDPIEDVTGLLDRASSDIDTYLGWPAPIAAGDRIDTTLLTGFQVDMLARACCAQAAYRLTIGEDELTEDRPRLLAAGMVTFSGIPIDRVGPEVVGLLSGAGLLRRTGTAAPSI